jgi:diguanylate cyclase (GGDEF)-like protein
LNLLDLKLWLPLGAAVALVIVLLATMIRHRRVQAELTKTRNRLARAEAQTKEHSRLISRLRSEKGSVASLALSLPTVLQELNRGNVDPRRVPALILSLADTIFQPVSHYGFGDVPDALKRVPFGAGKIGWVAAHRIDMLREDWLNPARTEGDKIDDNHPSLRPDIVGPLVHRSMEGEQVLGVLCLGSLGTRPRDEKLMFQLVTNLGSLALFNANLVTRLRGRANTDGLTSLLNKRYFMEELVPRMIYAAGREAQQLALFIFDIDHFKNYNDTNGHPAGDHLLRVLSKLLRSQVRPGDQCCRYGGEEFIVAMPDTNREEAYKVAERIRAAIEAFAFPHQENQPGGSVTISGGVAAMPHDGNSAADLTRHADVALYESKQRGRNLVTMYHGVDIGDADDASGFDLVAVKED